MNRLAVDRVRLGREREHGRSSGERSWLPIESAPERGHGAGFDHPVGIEHADVAVLRPVHSEVDHRLPTMKTLRFLFIARAGRPARIGGRKVLRLSANPATQKIYERTIHAIAA